jgi:hypothetical protein
VKVLVAFALALLTLSLGCLLFDAQESYTTQLSLNNTDDSPRTFEVYVVNDSATIHVERNDGLSYGWNVTEGVGTIDPGDGYHYTTVDPPNAARDRGTFVVDSGNATRISVENMTEPSVLLVVLSNEEGEILSWVSANCGDAQLQALEVTSVRNTSSVTHACG